MRSQVFYLSQTEPVNQYYDEHYAVVCSVCQFFFMCVYCLLDKLKVRYSIEIHYRGPNRVFEKMGRLGLLSVKRVKRPFLSN